METIFYSIIAIVIFAVLIVLAILVYGFWRF